MQSSRIEQKIDDIYSFVESCKMQHLSTTKVVVPKNELYDLLDDLQRDIPEEIKRYRKMLKQRDAILEDAENKAVAILSDAQEQYKALVEEHTIMQEAYQQGEVMVQQADQEAERIIGNARAQAEEIGSGAIYYTNDLLEMAEQVITNAYESAAKNSQALENNLQGYLEVIRQNKAELVQDTGQEDDSEESYSENEYDESDQEWEDEPQ